MATAPSILIRNLKLEHDAVFKAIQDEYYTTLPSYKCAMIIVDPYQCNPLSALMCFRTEQPAQIYVEIGNQFSEVDVSFTFPKVGFELDHFLPLAGLHADQNNKIRYTINYESGEPEYGGGDLIMPSLPESSVLLPKIKVPADFDFYKDINLMENGFTFLAPLSAYLIGVDPNNQIRWLLTGDYVNAEWSAIERLRNGNFLVSFGFYELREVDILGRCIRQTLLNSRMHHDWYELDDGKLLITTEDPENPNNYVMDVISVINYPTSAENVSEFRLREVLDVSRMAIPNVNAQGPTEDKDWLHINRSVYDPSTNSIILSGRHQDAVLSIDANAGALGHTLTLDDIHWIMGPRDNWTQDYLQKLLTPLDSNGEIITTNAANLDFWNWGQHSVTLPAGQPSEPELTDIIIFNNGNYRSYDPALQVPAAENYSECSRYRINTSAMTIQRTWTYGRERGSLRYGSYVGSVRDYDTTYLVNHGGICLNDDQINVGTNWGDPDNDGSISKINPHVCIYEVLKETRKVIWAIEFSWSHYPYSIFYNFKAFRAPMYPTVIYN